MVNIIFKSDKSVKHVIGKNNLTGIKDNNGKYNVM